MQEVHEKLISNNLTALVDLTSNVEDVLKILKEKQIIDDYEENKILSKGSPFDIKSQLYWLITKKESPAFDTLVHALRSTGNGEAADKLQDNESGKHVVQSETNVTVESIKSNDQEGIGFDTEKEFERIQSEVESEQEQEEQSKETPEAEIASAIVSEVFQEALEKVFDQVEPEVLVKVTPPESDPEVEDDFFHSINKSNDEMDDASEVEIALAEKIEVDVPAEKDEPKFTDIEPKSTEIELKFTEIEPKVNEETAEDEVTEEPRKDVRKQVKFESSKEFVIRKDESGESESNSEPSISPNSKSLVQQNREKFEKHAPAGVKVKYSFKKNEAVEEPKESTVKNLRSFFQKLGSVDDESVKTRSNTKLGRVHPDRKSMAS